MMSSARRLWHVKRVNDLENKLSKRFTESVRTKTTKTHTQSETAIHTMLITARKPPFQS